MTEIEKLAADLKAQLDTMPAPIAAVLQPRVFDAAARAELATRRPLADAFKPSNVRTRSHHHHRNEDK